MYDAELKVVGAECQALSLTNLIPPGRRPRMVGLGQSSSRVRIPVVGVIHHEARKLTASARAFMELLGVHSALFPSQSRVDATWADEGIDSGAMIAFASYLAENARPTYERITAWVARRIGQSAELVAGAWETRLRMLDDGRVHIGFICGWPYSQRFDRPDRTIELLCAPVMAPPRYQGRPIYFTDIIVHRGSPCCAFADLRGRAYAYNGSESHSGYNVPRDHLLSLGETSGYFGRTVASGSHQTSIEMVADGTVDAAGIDSTVLDLELTLRPELRGALRVVESIGPGPIPPVVVARSLAEDLKKQLREVFLAMHEDPEGRVILAGGLIARFVAVQDADYDPIRSMVRRAQTAGFLTLR